MSNLVSKESRPVHYLKDYRPHPYEIKKTHLKFELVAECTRVSSRLDVCRRDKSCSELILNGECLTLLSIKLNGAELAKTDYKFLNDSLIINADIDQFTLEISVEINPKSNSSLEGLYLSHNQFYTQNEPEGFRKITYYIDRPDNMAIFTTEIIANKVDYPILLSNGNLIEKSDLQDGRHRVVWNDPYPKPSYLFALVAGDFDCLTDQFITKSGKQVCLQIYVDKGNLDKSTFAMESLKNSMRWDEEVFGLEYDLDIYMIVAVDAFNMGAMENKGLNIFNAAYVLAKPSTATDDDYLAIEGVIGHEYFHNWTGNRVTCRDWFQLTLKEGLTVFRDQEFSADMTDRSLKRIQDVIVLKANQFAEDASAMSHPIKPISYMEINNFYTATVYEKGAEVIRMVDTIIGREKFVAGIKKYFELYDGQAVTTEDFIYAMEIASQEDLTLFKNWYKQSGTPEISYELVLAPNGVHRLKLKQIVKDNYILDIPIRVAFFDLNSGKQLSVDGKTETLLRLDQIEKDFDFKLNADKVVVSLNRGFTAPIKVSQIDDIDDLVFLFQFDSDEFNRFNAAQSLLTHFILRARVEFDEVLFEKIITCYQLSLDSTELTDAFKALCLSVPSVKQVNDQLDFFDIEGVTQARRTFMTRLACRLSDLFLSEYTRLSKKLLTTTDRKTCYGLRSLKNSLLDLALYDINSSALNMVKDLFATAQNMTDEIFSLRAIVQHGDSLLAQKSLGYFYDKWKDDSLIMNKWFALQAENLKDYPDLSFEDQLDQLASNKSFDSKNPNKLRRLWGSFAMSNLALFHHESGRGYQKYAQVILNVDKLNPQVASRLAVAFNRVAKLRTKQKKLAIDAMKLILDNNELSSDTYEVISKYVNH